MWILGIDTCSETVSVGLLGEGVCIHRRESAPRQQLTILIPMIKEILAKSGIGLEKLDLIALTTGPGSFTGIRLGIATVKTLSQVQGIPVVPLNTLDVIARNACANLPPYSTKTISDEDLSRGGCILSSNGSTGFQATENIVIPSIDARKSEIFFAVYLSQGNRVIRLGEYRKEKVENYFKFIKDLKDPDSPSSAALLSTKCDREILLKPHIITGSIFLRYSRDFLNKYPYKFIQPPEEDWFPSGLTIATMGKEMAERGETVDFMHILPNYMRESDAKPPPKLI